MPSVPDGIRVIAGLGNCGDTYRNNRHNVGFWFVDELAHQHNARFTKQNKFYGSSCRINLSAGSVLLFKPEQFINRSGSPLARFIQYHKLAISQVLVVHDEIDFDIAKIRLKNGGGSGGHNGLADIIQCLGQDFWRLRIGIGHPRVRSKVVDYVLADPADDDRVRIDTAMEKAIAQIENLVAGQFELAMNQLHSVEVED